MNPFQNPIANNDGAYIFAYMGIVASLVFANIGAAIGTAKSGMAICATEVISIHQLIKSFIPIVISGVLGIYGLIVSVVLSAQGRILIKSYSLAKQSIDWKKGYSMLGSGLVCGLSSLAAGVAIGYIGDAGVRALNQQGKLFGGFIMLLIFAEALGLYGLIVALLIA